MERVRGCCQQPYLFFMDSEDETGGLVVVFRLEVGNCLKTIPMRSQCPICPAACLGIMWLLLHTDFKAAFTPPKEFSRFFFPSVSYCAYTHIDAKITFPFMVCPGPLSSLETVPAYATNPFLQSVYGSIRITCNV